MLKGISRYLLPALAIIALLVALIPSSSRWLAVAQFKTALFPSQNPWTLKKFNEIVKNNPKNLDLNLGDCNFWLPKKGGLTASEQLQNINDLIRKFPDQPAAYAIAMSDLTMIGVGTGREKDQELTPVNDKNNPWANVHIPSPSVPLLHQYDKYGIIAEKLDPNNAYFPFMRSVALFGLHQDKLAIREIIRAGNCTVWNDYIKEMVEGRLKLADEIGMGRESIIRNYIIYFVLFPHLDKLRSTTRIAIHDAIIMEKSGDFQNGFIIRRALRKIGNLIMSGGTDDITPLVGLAITAIAGGVPGGTPPNVPKNIPEDKRIEIRINHYTSYLIKIKHPEEAKAYRSDIEAGINMKKKIQAQSEIGGVDSFDLFGSYSYNFIILIFAFIGSSVILFRGIIFLLCLGATAFLLYKIAPLRKYQTGFMIYLLSFVVLEYLNYMQLPWFLSVYDGYMSSYGFKFDSFSIISHIVSFFAYVSAMAPILPFALSLLIPRIFHQNVPEVSLVWMKKTFVTWASAFTLIWFCIFQMSLLLDQAYLNQHVYSLFR